MKSILLEALEYVGTPATGETWEAVWESANGDNVIAYFEASPDVAQLFGLVNKDAPGEEGYILDLDEESFSLIQRLNAAKVFTTLQVFAAQRYQMHRWIEALKREVERADRLIGY